MSNGIVKSNTTTNKSFDYGLGSVRLNFSLRTDIKQELKDFLEILERAKVDVQETLNELE